MCQLLKETANGFRIGTIGSSNDKLVITIDHLHMIVNDLDEKIVHQVNTAIKQALEAQHNHDYLYLADILEYHILSALHNSNPVIRQTKH